METITQKNKRQNRDRQRAWRERKRVAANPEMTSTKVTWQGHGILKVVNQADQAISESSSSKVNPLTKGNPGTATNLIPQHRPKTRKLTPPLLPYTTDFSLNLPAPIVRFPLSPDHQLLTLVQFNLVHAMISNMSILSLLYCLPTTCSTSFGVPVLDAIPHKDIPIDLQPTPLQKSTSYPFWISAIPVPAMRDNLILLAGTYDCNDLCYDLGQALYEGFDDVERRGCLVWGDSWNVSSWEVTEGFVRKWGFLLDGCQDLIESTNRWREIRGEDRLIVEI